MNAHYRLNLSWFAVLVAAQMLVMSTFLVAAPVAAADPFFCSSESGFVLISIANYYAAPVQLDSNHAPYVLARQSSSAPQTSDSGIAAYMLAKQASMGSASALDAYRSGFSPDAGFMGLYNPLAAQPGAFCYVPLSR